MLQLLHRLMISKWILVFLAALGFITFFGIIVAINSLFPIVSIYLTLAAPLVISSLTTTIGIVLGSRISDTRPALEIGAVAGAAIGSAPVYFGLAALSPAVGLFGTAIVIAAMGAVSFAWLGESVRQLFENQSKFKQNNIGDEKKEPILTDQSVVSFKKRPPARLSSSSAITASLPPSTTPTPITSTTCITKAPAAVSLPESLVKEASAYSAEMRRTAVNKINNLVNELSILLRNNTSINQWKQFYATNSEFHYIRKFTSAHWFNLLSKKIENGEYDNTPRVKELFDQASKLMNEHNQKIDSSSSYFSNLNSTISQYSERNDRAIVAEQELRRDKINGAGGLAPPRFKSVAIF
jgi:hypothetical protein